MPGPSGSFTAAAAPATWQRAPCRRLARNRAQIHSTNPLERLNGEVKRRSNVVGIFHNEAAIVRLVGALLLEQNDEWAIQRRYMSLETLAGLGDTGRRA